MIVADVPTNEALILVAAISAVPGITAAVLGYLNRRAIKTPSGERLGVIAERTHHLAETTSVHTTMLLNGQTEAAKEREQP